MSLQTFIQNFISRKGPIVLFSSFLSKVVNFIVIIAVIRILSKEDYGYVTYSLTILSFLAPFIGAGLHQGLLRYGALSAGQYDKKILFGLTFRRGMQFSLVIAGLLMFLSPFLTRQLPGSAIYLLLMGFQFIALFAFQMIQVYCRLIHQNKLFATIDMQNNLLLLVFNISLCYFFGGLGYIVSMIGVPLFLSVYYLKKLNLFSNDVIQATVSKLKLSLNFKELFLYGLYMSIASVLAQLLFAVDILLIGNMLSDAELVAQYKASSIIPFSLLILAVAVLTTDFVKLANASGNNKPALQQYYINYLKVFSFISIGIFLFFHFFSEPLLSIFGSNYTGHAKLMKIFSIGIIGGLLFRVPLGNLLSAIGWPRTNALFSIIILILNVGLGYFMILKYGMEGAAYTTSALMWLSGLFSLGAFVYYLKKKD